MRSRRDIARGRGGGRDGSIDEVSAEGLQVEVKSLAVAVVDVDAKVVVTFERWAYR